MAPLASTALSPRFGSAPRPCSPSRAASPSPGSTWAGGPVACRRHRALASRWGGVYGPIPARGGAVVVGKDPLIFLYSHQRVVRDHSDVLAYAYPLCIGLSSAADAALVSLWRLGNASAVPRQENYIKQRGEAVCFIQLNSPRYACGSNPFAHVHIYSRG
jgi:hypothetical protein